MKLETCEVRVFTTSGLGNNFFQLCNFVNCKSLLAIRFLEKENLITKLIGFKVFHEYQPVLDRQHSHNAGLIDFIAFFFLCIKWIFRKTDNVSVSYRSTVWCYGYFQKEYHFCESHLNVENLFCFNEKTADDNDNIFLHCRRGDFGDSALKVDYYVSAISSLRMKYEGTISINVIGIGSKKLIDELRLHFGNDTIQFVDQSISCVEDDFNNLKLAKVLIGSNSTLCFWAAVLGKSKLIYLPYSSFAESYFKAVVKRGLNRTIHLL